ncbi:MAG: rRNA maturation RNase YbeY [Clostridia bacterium]|nr:rRNA maturation RNase YbeY [Clostridia bacterium]
MRRELKISFTATEKFPEIDYELKCAVRRAILETLEYEEFIYPAEVSVTFCSAAYIKELNRTYRNKDSETDVLSFPLYDNGDFDPIECAISAVLGDIVISVPRAREQAAQLGNSFTEEVQFLAIHSTLHLLGYDHERSPEDEEAQCAAQREIKEALNSGAEV